MSSHVTSVNHSMESTSSSLQRSGLGMSVGDTKSIVLALQALQEKIRRLEQDRNHHQDQYEKALRAHEVYKQDVEHQLEQERANHRQREKELQEMVQRAIAEKTRLQTTLEESRKDLGTFRTELEEMLAKECETAQKRENALATEVEKLRQELQEEQKRRRTLLTSIEELRVEKEAALDRNLQLEQAIGEITHTREANGENRSHLRNGDVSRLTSERHKRNSSMSGRRRCVVRQGSNGVKYTFDHVDNSHRSGNTRQRESRPSSALRSNSARHTYRDPTYSSIQRDIRQGGVGHNQEGNATITTSTVPVPTPHGGEQGRPHSRSAMGVTPRTQPTVALEGGRRNDAIAEVRQELQDELNGLHQQYKETVERAAREDISPEVVTATLSRLANVMDRKAEQIRLIAEAQHDMTAAGVAVEVPTSRPTSAPRRASPPVGADKTTQRNLIVNELRSIFSQQQRL
ncbi:uncharacterized protein TM35_000023510 [Trypanosoma theileri]|uniref:Uncharacterized protein n=1 Tax=Trypanosoma theileri TaxID=67003 RepID=A0A1X0P856_9TRYP|nr:uncharacterized protein TM35_000023510 [Trypanosoma theileri]ORC93025.1 hypothetical protein TM35_000023510 [Trypanosoma theileri]